MGRGVEPEPSVGRSLGGASLARSSGLYKSSLAASEFGGGSYRPGVVMLSPAELAAALDGDEENDDDDDGEVNIFERTFTGNTSASVASRISRLTGVGEYFEMTPTEFDTRIVLLEPLGQGASGVVYRAALVNPASRDVAVKLLHRGGVGATRPQLVEFRREIDILRSLDHPRIVKVLGACLAPPRMSIVQEFVDGGSLHEVLHSSEHDTVRDGANFGGSEDASSDACAPGTSLSKISFRAQLTVAVDVADAVDYLHNSCDPKVIHRDLKPQNVLVDVRGRAKLADFGEACEFDGDDALRTYVGTRWYRAPELLLGQPYAGADGATTRTGYGQPVDMWAVGCLMGELTDGEPLFPGDSDVDQLRLLQRCLGRLTPGQMMAFSLNPNNAGVTFDDLRDAEPEGLDARYAGKMSTLELDFCGRLLTMNPKERITGEECLRHPYLAEHNRAED